MEGSEERVLTPKKFVNKASGHRRICSCSFLVKYGTGKSGRMSTENLFEVSNRDGSRGQVLATMCENIGIYFVKKTNDRIFLFLFKVEEVVRIDRKFSKCFLNEACM